MPAKATVCLLQLVTSAFIRLARMVEPVMVKDTLTLVSVPNLMEEKIVPAVSAPV